MFNPQDFTLEKWTSQCLGPDMVKKVKENQYINIGQMKNVIEYIFSNMYSDKFSRAVDLNLNLENEGFDLTDKSNELTQLKIKLIEMKREKSQLERLNSERELEANSMAKDILEHESTKNKLGDNSIMNQHLNIMLTEEKLNKKKAFKQKIEKVNEKITDFLNENTNESNDFESLVHNFSHLKRTGSTPKKFENFQSRCSQKLNESQKLWQILDERHLENEVNLLKYQKSNEFSMQNVQSLDAAINQELLNLIVLSSQSHKFTSEKKTWDQQFEQIKKNFPLAKYYRDAYKNLYARLFRTHLILKKTESDFNELTSIFEQLKTEKDFYRNSYLAITQNFDRIKKLDLNIHEKQLSLEDLFNENCEFFNQRFQLNLNKIKISSDQLVELLRGFSSNNPFMNTSRNDSTMFNSSKLMNQYKMLNKLSMSQQQLAAVVPEFKLNLLEEMFGATRAKCFIFTSLMEDFMRLIKEVKIINMANEQRLSNQEAKKVVSDLTGLLTECEQFDRDLVEKYLGLLRKKNQDCTDMFKSMPKMEDLLSIWVNQPGVYECYLENFTVDSKTLEYYIGYLNELVNQKNRNFM